MIFIIDFLHFPGRKVFKIIRLSHQVLGVVEISPDGFAKPYSAIGFQRYLRLPIAVDRLSNCKGLKALRSEPHLLRFQS